MASPMLLQAIISQAYDSFNKCKTAVRAAAKFDAVRLFSHLKKLPNDPRCVLALLQRIAIPEGRLWYARVRKRSPALSQWAATI